MNSSKSSSFTNNSASIRSISRLFLVRFCSSIIPNEVAKRAGGFSGSCSVPRLPNVVIGLDYRLDELKHRLLKDDDNQVLTVSTPGGCGKTTLAKMVCHDGELKLKV